jgi:hypothetical protein
VGQRSAADRCGPGALRYLAGDGPPFRAGRVGELRVLRRALALVLGVERRAMAATDPPIRTDAGFLATGVWDAQIKSLGAL